MSLSRIGKLPIEIPSGVTITVDSGDVTVEGPKGKLVQFITPAVTVEVKDGVLTVSPRDESKAARSQHGLMRALINNMVTGVTKGFEKKLNLVGVGYRAQAAGDTLNLSLGFSHPVVHQMPAGVKVETPTQTEIVIKGVDKQAVGKVAAEVRAYRAPEPYKGKGVRYSDEVVSLKETKKK